MSRSAADATRFTATGPYASSKPGAAAPRAAAPYKLPGFLSGSANNNKKSKQSAPQGQGDGPGGKQETPREKVERLRAQARAARVAQSTSHVDRLIDVGRRFANRAHKVMVYTLIAASGVCGALTVYSVISLTLYNRRQRALWLDRELEKLQNARLAYANNTATPEQIEILKNEKIGEIVKQKREEEKEQRPWNRAKRYLFGGLKTEENATEASSEAAAAAAAVPENKSAVLEALNATKAAELESTGSGDKAVTQSSQQPGSLDVMAENAETAAKETARSWKSWFFAGR